MNKTTASQNREALGQLALFDLEKYTAPLPPIPDREWVSDTSEPPDPDDSPNYEQAWCDWVNHNPDLVQYAAVMSPCESVGAQAVKDTLASDFTNNKVKLAAKKSAPQHDTHWIEKYWVERSGNKFWYYRYCWMVGRKKHRRYIGSVHSPKARDRKLAIEAAISDGCTPQEIEKIIISWRELKQ